MLTGLHVYTKRQLSHLLVWTAVIMTLSPPMVKLVVFHANTKCMDDLELFKEVCDMATRATMYIRLFLGK